MAYDDLGPYNPDTFKSSVEQEMKRTPKQQRAKRIIDSINAMAQPNTHTLQKFDRVTLGGPDPLIGQVVEVVSNTSVRVQWPHLQDPRLELGERLRKCD